MQDRLIRAAQQAIAAEGWTGASSRKIAQRGNLNPALINYYFRSKNALLFAALQASATKIAKTLGELPPHREAGITEWLCHSVRALQGPMIETEMRVLLEATVHAPKEPKLLEFAQQQLQHFRSLLADFLQREVKQDRLRVSPGKQGKQEILHLASAFAALADGLAIQVALDPGIEVEKILQAIVPRLLSPQTPPSDDPST